MSELTEITDLFRQAMERSDNTYDAVPAVVAALTKLKKAGVASERIIVLDTNGHGAIHSMQNTVIECRKEVKELSAKIKRLEDQLEAGSAGMSWEEHLRVRAAQRWLNGESLAAIASELSEHTGKTITTNMLTQQLYNSAPPSCMKATVRANGTPDWLELWYLGSQLRQGTTESGKRDRGWLSALGRVIPDLPKFGSPLDNINTDTLAELRRAHRGATASSHNKEALFERVKEAGSAGVLRQTLLSEGFDQRRIGDLITERGIFNAAPEGKPDLMVWVGHRQDHEEAFAREMKKLAARQSKKMKQFEGAA